MIYDDNRNRIRWIGCFEALKNFVEYAVKLRGKWSSPGGTSKKFTCSSLDLTITWYYGKWNTLILHGRESSMLIDILSEIGKKSPHSDVMGEQISSVADHCREPALTETNGVSGEISVHACGSETYHRNAIWKRDCDCQFRLLAAELEDVKLDLSIIQSNVESRINAGKIDEITQLKEDLNIEREKSKRLEATCKQLEGDILSLVRGRSREVSELNNIIELLETKVRSIEALN